MSETIILEACVETLEQAILAERVGAHRIELCERLDLGGITPSEELIRLCRKSLSIPIMVMVRTRGGDFTCSESEFVEMKRTIAFCKTSGVEGIVFGILSPSITIDLERTAILASLAIPLQVTFHKAIDLLSDPVEGVNLLKTIPNLHRVLTSGGAETAIKGQENIRKMIEESEEYCTIITAGKVTKDNWREVQKATGAKELHGRRIVF